MDTHEQSAETPNAPAAGGWRDPLALGFEAHRGLLLLKLRLHASADRRKSDPTRQSVRVLSIAAARRRRSARAADITSSGPIISNSQSGNISQ